MSFVRRVLDGLWRKLPPGVYGRFRSDPMLTGLKLKDLASFALRYGVPLGLLLYFQPAERFEVWRSCPELEEYFESIGELRPLRYKNRYTREEVWERMMQARLNPTKK